MSIKECVICRQKKFLKKTYAFPEGAVLFCKKCGLANFQGLPPDYPDLEFKETEFSRTIKRIFLALEFGHLKKKKNLRLLEIGSGSGELAYYLKKMGHQVTCSDISKKSLNVIRKKYRLPIIYGSIDRAKLPANYFDGIIMRHVLEHIEDPVSCIKILHATLKDKGKIYLTTPNYESWARKFAAKKWNWCLPNHRYFWTAASLALFLRQNGFKIFKTKNIFTPSGFSQALDNLIAKRSLRYLARPLTLPLGLAIELISMDYRQGQNLYMEAQKK